MANKHILALDQSMHSTGWALWQNSTLYAFGNLKVPSKYTGDDCRLRMKDAVEEVIEEWTPTHLVLEDVYKGRSVSTALMLGKLFGNLEAIGWRVAAEGVITLGTGDVAKELGISIATRRRIKKSVAIAHAANCVERYGDCDLVVVADMREASALYRAGDSKAGKSLLDKHGMTDDTTDAIVLGAIAAQVSTRPLL